MTESGQVRVQTRLIAIWQRTRPQLLARLDVLEQAARAAAEDRLNQPLRADATSIAHKLAGSLGMFGFAEGTRLAREIELTLELTQELTPGGEAAGQLETLTRQLRHEIADDAAMPGLKLIAG